MGFIKSIQTSISGQYNDQFKEVIRSGGFEDGLIVKKVTTENGVIQDKSRLFVEPAECAILVDNGAIKDVISEPGMYFMDTSAPTLFQSNIFSGIEETIKEAIKRIAYQGDVITGQAVYYINLAEQIGLGFNTGKPIIYKDPVWGPTEIFIDGNYAIKVVNPVFLLTNVLGNKPYLRIENLENAIRPYLASSVSSEIATSGLSFDELASKQSEFGLKLTSEITNKIESFGIEVTKIVIYNIDVSEEVKKSMRDRTAIKMKATSANEQEADIYAKLNKAEAMKDLANNPSSTSATVMGMNMGSMFGAEIKEDK